MHYSTFSVIREHDGLKGAHEVMEAFTSSRVLHANTQIHSYIHAPQYIFIHSRTWWPEGRTRGHSGVHISTQTRHLGSWGGVYKSSGSAASLWHCGGRNWRGSEICVHIFDVCMCMHVCVLRICYHSTLERMWVCVCVCMKIQESSRYGVLWHWGGRSCCFDTHTYIHTVAFSHISTYEHLL
jgi:hypothetical protein